MIEVASVRKEFPSPSGGRKGTTVAVAGASFVLAPGRTFGIVGESGSGKSTLGRLVLGLETPTSGSVTLDGIDISTGDRAAKRAFRKRVQPVFQDPRSALNWKHSIREILTEPLANIGVSRSQALRRAEELLEQVHLPVTVLARRPRELSGGMLQRVAIARALALDPEYLVCDEVLSALDVSIQAGIVNLLLALQRDTGLAMLFISHDLEVVRHISDDVLVMNQGEVVEQGDAEAVYGNPQHEYTRYLLGA